MATHNTCGFSRIHLATATETITRLGAAVRFLQTTLQQTNQLLRTDCEMTNLVSLHCSRSKQLGDPHDWKGKTGKQHSSDCTHHHMWCTVLQNNEAVLSEQIDTYQLSRSAVHTPRNSTSSNHMCAPRASQAATETHLCWLPQTKTSTRIKDVGIPIRHCKVFFLYSRTQRWIIDC